MQQRRLRRLVRGIDKLEGEAVDIGVVEGEKHLGKGGAISPARSGVNSDTFHP
jgi:hypothetical protein